MSEERGADRDDGFARDLTGAFAIAAAAAQIGSPVEHQELLLAIVETAAHVCDAEAGSLFLIDADNGDLYFEVAIGPKAAEVKHLRVPLGQGVAGLVAVTGQAMAVADARNDPQVFDGIADRIGQRPDNLLAVPLFFDDSVIGVLELLDKRDGSSFDGSDMATLERFARQAATAIQLSRTYRHLAPFVGEVLSSLGATASAEDGEDRADTLVERADRFADGVEGDPVFRRTLRLAALVQEIASRGEAESEAIETILRGFAGYLRDRADDAGDFTL